MLAPLYRVPRVQTAAHLLQPVSSNCVGMWRRPYDARWFRTTSWIRLWMMLKKNYAQLGLSLVFGVKKFVHPFSFVGTTEWSARVKCQCSSLGPSNISNQYYWQRILKALRCLQNKLLKPHRRCSLAWSYSGTPLILFIIVMSQCVCLASCWNLVTVRELWPGEATRHWPTLSKLTWKSASQRVRAPYVAPSLPEPIWFQGASPLRKENSSRGSCNKSGWLRSISQ